MKYNILIVYDVPDWAYHFRAKALMKYAPEDFSVTISSSFEELLHKEDYHLVFFLPFSHVRQLTEYCNQIGKSPIITTSFNIGWGYANNWLEEARKYSNAVIITNFQMWDKSGRLPNTFYLPNGVDRDIFKYEIPVENRKSRLLWCGSEFHRKIKGYDDILIPLELSRRYTKSRPGGGILRLHDSVHTCREYAGINRARNKWIYREVGCRSLSGTCFSSDRSSGDIDSKYVENYRVLELGGKK